MLDTVLQDVRYALRTLKRAPAFTTAAVSTLALGIGATALVFSMVYAVLIRPFPYPEPERLVTVDETDRDKGEEHIGTSFPNFVSWREAAGSFERMAAYDTRSMSMRTAGEAAILNGARVSADLFRTLRIEPVAGRHFTAEEDQPGGDRVVAISNAVWQRDFNGDRGAIGRTIHIDAEPHTIVAVMPDGFDFPSAAQAWVPLRLDDSEDRGNRYLGVVARLRDGAVLAQAQAELTGIAAKLEHLYPGPNSGHSANVQNLQAATIRKVRPVLFVLFGAVGFVLLIACANVANLMLARAAGRDREMAIRGAIGAGGARLVRQLLTESLVIALLGAVAGTLLSAWWLDVIVSRLPADVPVWMHFSIDRAVLFFVIGTAALTAVVFGLAPALQAGRTDLQASLKEGGRASDGMRRARLRSAFVVAQLTAAIVLLVGGFLMARSLVAMQRVNPGFDQAGVITMRIALPPARYTDDAAISTFHSRMLTDLAGIPGVERAALASWFPISGSTQTSNFSIAGVGEIENANAYNEAVTNDYFAAMGIPILRGRAFDPRDRANGAPVAIINQKMADVYFAGVDPIGKGIMFGAGGDDYRTIVGVAGNVNQRDVNQPEIGVDIYTPMQQTPRLTGALVVRARPASPEVIRTVRARIRSLDSDIPVFDVATVQEVLKNATWDARLTGGMIGLFASAATLLAVIGLYGVISYGVQQRTHEISVRVALGATRHHVMSLVFRQGVKLTAVGVAMGLALSFALSRTLGNVLFGVSSTDPVTFVAVPALLAGIAMIAMYIPARRATRLDAITALRGD